jgi:hypothetical protein
MPMAPDQIRADRCYLLRADNGREIVAKVIKIREHPLTLLNENHEQPAVMRFNKVLFLWRQTIEGSPWSGGYQNLSVTDFAIRAEKEVGCD